MRVFCVPVIPLIVCSLCFCGCDSAGVSDDNQTEVDECTPGADPVRDSEFVQLYDTSVEPQRSVVGLHFFQTITSFTGANCDRADSTAIALLVSTYGSVWETSTFSFAAEFRAGDVGWSYENAVEDVLPLDEVELGVVAREPTLLSEGTLTAGFTSSVEYSEPEMPTFKLTNGACGHVVFREHLGTDLDSAVSVIKSREVAMGGGNLSFELVALEVEDRLGSIPATSFFGVRVLDADTGRSLRSLFHVASTSGDMYILAWCPD